MSRRFAWAITALCLQAAPVSPAWSADVLPDPGMGTTLSSAREVPVPSDFVDDIPAVAAPAAPRERSAAPASASVVQVVDEPARAEAAPTQRRSAHGKTRVAPALAEAHPTVSTHPAGKARVKVAANHAKQVKVAAGGTGSTLAALKVQKVQKALKAKPSAATRPHLAKAKSAHPGASTRLARKGGKGEKAKAAAATRLAQGNRTRAGKVRATATHKPGRREQT
jgi:hypothetical protein